MGRLIYIPAPGGIAYTYTKSLDLDGVNEYVNFGDQSVMDGAGAFSIVAWVKFDNIGATATVISKRDAGGVGWQFGRDSGNRLRFILEGTGGLVNVFTTNTLAANTWYMISVTTNGINAAGTQIYINGTAATMNTSFNTLSGSVLNNEPVLVGTRGATQFVDGKVFAVGFYTGALTGGNISTINALSPKDLSAGPGTLIFYPRFGNDPDDDATSGTGVIKDRVGGFDGTPMNTESGDIITDAPTP